MNPAATVDEAGLILSHERLEGVLSFLVSRAKGSARALTPSAFDVFKGCADAVNQMLRSVIEARSAAEFERIFDASFSRYVAVNLAMAHFAKAVVPKHVLERLTRESICEMEADFRDKGLAALGSAGRDQALFTVWTLRKINELVTQIMAAGLDESRKEADAEFCVNFNVSVFHAQFGLDCLNMALQSGQAIYPEVMERLIDCLRGMVNAYAWARRGVEGRLPTTEAPVTLSPPDEEDRALMDFSLTEAGDALSGEDA